VSAPMLCLDVGLPDHRPTNNKNGVVVAQPQKIRADPTYEGGDFTTDSPDSEVEPAGKEVLPRYRKEKSVRTLGGLPR